MPSPGRGVCNAGHPGARRSGQHAVLVLLRVLADIPDATGAVLRLERELGLLQLPVVDVPLEDDERADAVDLLRQVGDGGDDAVLVQLAVVADEQCRAGRC